ncbi:hypothetical protein LZ578_02305 [Jeotgalibaca sp. MA1X17-3]|uniref:hypothetical protein n=1 Tax=Jeotgalibaca sp. MA1X17-3 TaxID=2908211 RepID=UPI001F38A70A|nr:hypothetical protein [Jeotgalibaca sp. MA1X17-3]UJF15999.1 hypothetical protein LZ578_02305 [Jeotgalibaca sp. MA1X17-3]
MILTKEQILSCERMEENGGPKSYAGAMLYHQYKSNKNTENNREKIEMKDLVIEKVQEIQELENELKQQKIELQILLKKIS